MRFILGVVAGVAAYKAWTSRAEIREKLSTVGSKLKSEASTMAEGLGFSGSGSAPESSSSYGSSTYSGSASGTSSNPYGRH